MAVAVDQATFVAAFPEFGDVTVYPAGQFAFWEAEAERELPLTRFGSSLPLAIMLFVAHNLILSAQAARAVASGGSTDGVGIVSSKSVGSVSKSYDTTLTAIDGAGPWNATSYGQRFYRLLKSFGAGPMYVPQFGSPPSFARLFPF